MENIYVAFGNRREQVQVFVYSDGENKTFYFALVRFLDMSLDRLYVFLSNSELTQYILNVLADFEFGKESKNRGLRFRTADKRYEPTLDIENIKKLRYFIFIKGL